MERMGTEDWLRVVLDQTQLIAKLEHELTLAQRKYETDTQQLHAQYGQKLQNLKDKLGEMEGKTDVQPSTE